jgi:hypothetical protein
MLLLSAVAPLLVADVALGGIRSIIPRFVAPAYLVLTVSLAYLVSGVLRAHGAWMRAACACAGIVVVAAAAGSYGMRWGADVWWNQDDGAAAESSAVATLVNGLPRPQLISTGLGTLLELSHYLRPGTPIRVVVDGREPPLQRGQSYILYGSPASGAAAARLDRLLSDIRRRGDAKLELVSPQLPCCGAGIPTIPRQLWRVTPR